MIGVSVVVRIQSFGVVSFKRIHESAVFVILKIFSRGEGLSELLPMVIFSSFGQAGLGG
jgi:hypothetical protein